MSRRRGSAVNLHIRSVGDGVENVFRGVRTPGGQIKNIPELVLHNQLRRKTDGKYWRDMVSATVGVIWYCHGTKFGIYFSSLQTRNSRIFRKRDAIRSSYHWGVFGKRSTNVQTIHFLAYCVEKKQLSWSSS